MVSLKTNTFAVGFLTAVALWVALFAFNHFGFQGGHVEDSPSGKYTLIIMAPMSPTVAGTYNATLLEKATGNTLRNVKINLNSKEKTKALRGLPVTMVWDSTETAVDVLVVGAFLVRISTPSVVP